MKQCKIHRWRLGAGIAKFTAEGLSVTEYTVVWCERCDKRIKAYQEPKGFEKWRGTFK